MKLRKMSLGLTGILLVVLVLVAWFWIPLSHSPSMGSTGAYTLAYYAAHHSAELASFYVTAVMLGVVILYAAMLWRALRTVTRQHVLPATAFGGGIALVGGMTATGFAVLALIEGPQAGMTPATASALNAINNTDPIALQLGGAVMVIAAGLAILGSQHGRPMKALGALSLLIGVLLAVNPGFLVLFLVWIVVAGFALGIAASTFTAIPAPAPIPAAEQAPGLHSSSTVA